MPVSSGTLLAVPRIERNCRREKSNTVGNRCNRFRPRRETHGGLRKKFHKQSTQLTERRSPLLLTPPKATVAAMKNHGSTRNSLFRVRHDEEMERLLPAARLRGFSPPCYLRSATLAPFLSTSSLKKPRLWDALRTATFERQAEHGGPAVRRGVDEGDRSAARGLAMAEGGKPCVQRRAAWWQRDTHTPEGLITPATSGTIRRHLRL